MNKQPGRPPISRRARVLRHRCLPRPQGLRPNSRPVLPAPKPLHRVVIPRARCAIRVLREDTRRPGTETIASAHVAPAWSGGSSSSSRRRGGKPSGRGERLVRREGSPGSRGACASAGGSEVIDMSFPSTGWSGSAPDRERCSRRNDRAGIAAVDERRPIRPSRNTCGLSRRAA